MMNKQFNGVTNEKNFIYNVQDFEKSGFSDFQFISSWSMNYKSWIVQKKVPIKLIKYEDLINKTYAVFLEIVEFINNTTKNNQKIDKIKLKNTLKSTSFEILKKNEMRKGFLKQFHQIKTKTKKFLFFILGQKTIGEKS